MRHCQVVNPIYEAQELIKHVIAQLKVVKWANRVMFLSGSGMNLGVWDW